MGFEYEVYEIGSPKEEGIVKTPGLATIESFKSLHNGKTREDIMEWLGFFREKRQTLTCNENW